MGECDNNAGLLIGEGGGKVVARMAGGVAVGFTARVVDKLAGHTQVNHKRTPIV